MTDLTHLLASMTLAGTALAASDVVEAQRPIVQHIRKLTGIVNDMLNGLPDTDSALQVALPSLGEDLPRHLETIQHYSRLLLESPMSFGGATLTDEAQPYADALYQASRAFKEHCEALREQATQQRRDARLHTPSYVDWDALLQEDLPVLRFLLRQHPIQIDFTPYPSPLMIFARRYHTLELVRHIVLTLASELMAYGRISLHLEAEAACHALHITATGITLTPNEMNILFNRNGRHIYREQLDTDAGYMTFLRQPGVSSTIVVHLPHHTD